MNQLKKWLPVCGAVILVSMIIMWYVISTSTNLPKFSSNRQDWNDMGEFLGFIINPIIAVVAAYLILHTINVQNEMKLVDRYCLELDSIVSEIDRFKLDDIKGNLRVNGNYSSGFHWALVLILKQLTSIEETVPKRIKTQRGKDIVRSAYNRANNKLYIYFKTEGIISEIKGKSGEINVLSEFNNGINDMR